MCSLRNVKIVLKNHIEELPTDMLKFKIFKFYEVYNILKIALRRIIYKGQNVKIESCELVIFSFYFQVFAVTSSASSRTSCIASSAR